MVFPDGIILISPFLSHVLNHSLKAMEYQTFSDVFKWCTRETNFKKYLAETKKRLELKLQKLNENICNTHSLKLTVCKMQWIIGQIIPVFLYFPDVHVLLLLPKF